MSFSSKDHRDYRPPLSQGGTALWHCKKCGVLIKGSEDYCEEHKKPSSTITSFSKSNISSGDFIDVSVPEKRWWVRLWYFITFRTCPPVTCTYKVTEVEDLTITVEHESGENFHA